MSWIPAFAGMTRKNYFLDFWNSIKSFIKIEIAVVTGTESIAQIIHKNWNQIIITSKITIGFSQTALFITAGTRIFHSKNCKIQYKINNFKTIKSHILSAIGKAISKNNNGQI